MRDYAILTGVLGIIFLAKRKTRKNNRYTISNAISNPNTIPVVLVRVTKGAQIFDVVMMPDSTLRRFCTGKSHPPPHKMRHPRYVTYQPPTYDGNDPIGGDSIRLGKLKVTPVVEDQIRRTIQMFVEERGIDLYTAEPYWINWEGQS